jgi:pyrroloquinoline quinone biosynthesis protein B
MIKIGYRLLIFICLYSQTIAQKPYITVLGVAQDGGFPQAGCKKQCCRAVWEQKLPHRSVSCIALVDPISREKWIFDATPDFTEQLHLLSQISQNQQNVNGVFLTHAHIGHYTGLMYLGRETMGAKKVKVFAMPKMKEFLENNGPWSQLVDLQNIDIKAIEENKTVVLNERIKIEAFRVPHRDEFSETVGFKIITANKTLVYIPDIDKWQKWNQDISKIIAVNDYVLVDGTFYQDGEIDRQMSEVPHPFVSETTQLLKHLSIKDKKKVYFIHLNHTNPLLQPKSKECKDLLNKGFRIANQSQKIGL